jgi:hypothetical protein
MLQRINQGKAMKQDYVDLSEQAYEMRTQEIRRLNNHMLHDFWIALKWMGGKLLLVMLGISELLRPLFSWNPQPPRSHSH